MRNRINTLSVREIKHSFKRFISLVIMSLLGVGVFVGIKMAAPDMMRSLDSYYDQKNLYDIKVVSTLGLTKDDIQSLKKINGINKVYGSYSKDVLIKTNKDEVVSKIISITNDINKVEVKKGRLPKTTGEIVVEESFLKKENMKIGDKINLLDNDKTFKKTNLTIVGTVKSPLYISSGASSLKRGSTNIGSGNIDYYTYVLDDNFNISYYTEIYVSLDNTKKEVTNSKEYNKLVDAALKGIDRIKKNNEKRRYDEIYKQINDEIVKNETEANEKFNAYKKELDNAKITINEAKAKLDDANNYLLSSLQELNLNKEKLDQAKKTLNEYKVELSDASTKIEEAKNVINEELKDYNINYEDVKNIINMLNNLDKKTIIDMIPKELPNYDVVVDKLNKMDEQELKELAYNLIKNPQYIDVLIMFIPKELPNYDRVVTLLKLYKENPDKVTESLGKINEVIKAEEEYDKNVSLYGSSLDEYNKNNSLYNTYYNEYQNGLSTYNNNLRSYNSNLNLYNSKVEEYYNSKKSFNLEIIKAKKKLDEIPKSVWYVYKRLDDSNYSSYIDDGKSVSNLSKIFPTIFFVVAILISLISMSRMVEDDRMIIGTLKSLGFSNKHIRKKYLLYSGIATLLGGVLGSLLGFFILPLFIWNIYKILFDVPVFNYDFNPLNTVVGILIAIICICGTTLVTIRKVVKEKPSDLMRPKAPSNGKRVILEKIPFIWNKIKFSNKITIRNLFRYKKRVLMTVGGILGCTALMLAGFGIRDSITGIPGKQFGEIFDFDEMIYLANDLKEDEINNMFNSNHIITKLNTKMEVSMSVNGYGVNLFVPENEKDLKKIVNLKDLKTKEPLNLEDNKVIITDKLSELTNKKVNDKITLISQDNNKYEFVISKVSENYVGNYVFMNKNTYEKKIGPYNTNIVYVSLDDIKVENKFSKELLKNTNVMSIMSVNSTINNINDMLKSLNSVVLILIVLSGSLSLVILYNLSYINISERKREIATLKVLGFTDKEVDKYITKETVILTLIGICLGLIFGIFLTNVIVDTVEIEMVRFIRHIRLYSFAITSLLIILFTLVVNRVTHYTLKKIDMIESLKSVE